MTKEKDRFGDGFIADAGIVLIFAIFIAGMQSLHHSPASPQEVVHEVVSTTTVTLLQEKEDCKTKGGTFVVHGTVIHKTGSYNGPAYPDMSEGYGLVIQCIQEEKVLSDYTF